MLEIRSDLRRIARVTDYSAVQAFGAFAPDCPKGSTGGIRIRVRALQRRTHAPQRVSADRRKTTGTQSVRAFVL